MRPVAALALAVLAAAAPAGAADGAPAPARAREILALLRQDCGACHGIRLTGGLGPALTPGALRAKPSEGLVATIVSGRAGTPMPPWRDFLSESEARWLVARLLAGDADAPR